MVIPKQWWHHHNDYSDRLSTHSMVYYDTVTNNHHLPQGGSTTHIQPFLMFLLPTESGTRDLTSYHKSPLPLTNNHLLFFFIYKIPMRWLWFSFLSACLVCISRYTYLQSNSLIFMSSLNMIMLQLQILNNHSLILTWYAIIQNQFNLKTFSRAWCLITGDMCILLYVDLPHLMSC